MIVFFEKNISDECIKWNIKLISHLKFLEFSFEYKGVYILDGTIDEIYIRSNMKNVYKIIYINTPYKFVSREFKPSDTIVDIDGIKIGGGHFEKIGGPCSFEGEEMFYNIAKTLKGYGVNIVRGGAFKPRTSPYFFQGEGKGALKIMRDITNSLNLKLISEITSIEYIDLFCEYVDIIQVGTRNMQNYELLKSLGKIDKPILLKRGLSATFEEFLLSAEYIVSNGNMKVILCERGIRTFEKSTRNTFDVSVIPLVKKFSHLPIIVDPSHAAGSFDLVEPLALSGVSSGCDGVMIEVHNNPEMALSDGPQALKFDRFKDVSYKIDKIREVLFNL